MYGASLSYVVLASLLLCISLSLVPLLDPLFVGTAFVSPPRFVELVTLFVDSKLPLRVTVAVVIGAISLSFLAPASLLPYRWVRRVFTLMAQPRQTLTRGRFGKQNLSHEAQYARRNGGEVGGLTNEGNTCFMNSVLLSLASSHSLLQFIDDSIYEIVEAPDGSAVKTNATRRSMPFTVALKQLLDDLNGAYGLRGKEFSTRPLMKRMSDGPKQNFFMGYNQEDAQEFYQLVMRKVEKEFKKTQESGSTPEPEEKPTSASSISSSESTKYVDIDSVPGYISGCTRLGHLGKVYVPAHQINPNIADSSRQLYGMDLVTPVDGIAAERIGCVNCGETGGIRYSVISGLSLNLPYEQGFSPRYDLIDLLKQWEKPEIIDEVNCNRCGLLQTKLFLLENTDSASNEKLVANFEKRIAEIEHELEKDAISDEVFEKLTTKQMTRKTLKLKQILLSRPPPLLCIHINRSVIDPRTFMIVKNPKNLSFPAQLDLNPFVAVPEDINMDARLPFKRRDASKVSPSEELDDAATADSLESMTNLESKISRSDSEVEDDTKETQTAIDYLQIEEEIADAGHEQEPVVLNKDLLYNLKAVVTHMGTHHYGHYICYRKWRGSWWRVNDEIVSVASEDEVLRAPGTFMLFYEHKNADTNSSPDFEEQKTPDFGVDDEGNEFLLSLDEKENTEGEELFRGGNDSADKLFPRATFEVEEERAFV